MTENSQELDGNQRIALMSVSTLWIHLTNKEVIKIEQTGRTLIELHRHFGWDEIGQTVPPLEAWAFSAWWHLSKEGHPKAQGDHLDFAEHITKVEVELPESPKEGQRQPTTTRE